MLSPRFSLSKNMSTVLSITSNISAFSSFVVLFLVNMCCAFSFLFFSSNSCILFLSCSRSAKIFQDGIADWLFEYAGSGAADEKEALKMLAQYTVAESLYDVAVNRMNSFGDSLLEEGINRINLLENSE